MWMIAQIFVAFSEKLNFTKELGLPCYIVNLFFSLILTFTAFISTDSNLLGHFDHLHFAGAFL